jgi:hypothetical protein
VTSRHFPAVVLLLAFAVSAWADSKPAPKSGRQPMTQQTRLYIIRGLQSELVFARKPLPMTQQGIILHEDGTTTPPENELTRQMATLGPAARPGDRVRITNVKILKKSIVFELNGGLKLKKKWYQHIQIDAPVTASSAPMNAPENPHGSILTLEFKDFVPEMTTDELKKMLLPVLDFSSKSAAEAYLETIPPKAKEAIKNHQVLVGMDQEMVIYAKGRASRKIRENDSQAKPYEEWLYGEPPQDVEFVRFVNGEVVQVKIMKVDGEKIVRTEREIDLSPMREVEARRREQEQMTKPKPVANRPTLRRAGEQDDTRPPQDTKTGNAPDPRDPNQVDPTLGPPPTQGPQSAPQPAPPLPGPPDPSSPGR